jgi:hypothetical protein
MSQTTERSSNFFSTKNSQKHLDINILQIFTRGHPSDNWATGLFGRSADTSDVRINGNLRPSGNFSTKRRTPPSIFSRFQRDFRGALFHLREDSFLADKKYDKKLCAVGFNGKIAFNDSSQCCYLNNLRMTHTGKFRSVISILLAA